MCKNIFTDAVGLTLFKKVLGSTSPYITETWHLFAEAIKNNSEGEVSISLVSGGVITCPSDYTRLQASLLISHSFNYAINKISDKYKLNINIKEF